MSELREHELLVNAKELRKELTGIQVRISELIRGLAALDLPTEKFDCPTCGAGFSGKLSLSEHIYLSHGGPEPEHWLEAERKADEAA